MRRTPGRAHAVRALICIVLALLAVSFAFGVWGCTQAANCPAPMHLIVGVLSMVTTPLNLGFFPATHMSDINLWPYILPTSLVFFLVWNGWRYITAAGESPPKH